MDLPAEEKGAFSGKSLCGRRKDLLIKITFGVS